MSESSASAIEAATAFLLEELSDGAVLANDVDAHRRIEGISKRTLDRAKSKLGVKSRPVDGVWWWALPGGKDARFARAIELKDAKDANTATPTELGNLGNLEYESDSAVGNLACPQCTSTEFEPGRITPAHRRYWRCKRCGWEVSSR